MSDRLSDILSDIFVMACSNDFITTSAVAAELSLDARSVRRYKKAYNHKNTMATLEKSFKVYFDSLVFDRFSRFDADFEAIYDEE